MKIKPADYWRKSKKISSILGSIGEIVLATNGFALVSINSKKYEFPVVGKDKLTPGEKVVIVFRRLTPKDSSGLIGYTLKAKKLN
jgi:hypothetical protein